MKLKFLCIYRLENGDFELRSFPNKVLLTGLGLDSILSYVRYLMTTDSSYCLVSIKVFQYGDSNLQINAAL